MRRSLFLLWIVGLSCVHGGHLPGGFPQPTRGSSLALPSEMAPPNVSQQALAVVHHAPVKVTEGTSAIVVTFNQPMVALDPDAHVAVTCPFSVHPAVAGACRWIAADTIKLALAAPLKNAHTYRVTVPTSLASLSRARLCKPFGWRFESPRPALVNARLFPVQAERGGRMLVDDQLLLTFNVAVDPQRIAHHLQLGASGKRMSVSAVRYKKDPKKVLVRPDRSLPWNARVELIIPPKLLSNEGPLRSTTTVRRLYQTPTKLMASLSCDGKPLVAARPCWPMSNRFHDGISLLLSEPVRKRDLLRALRGRPAGLQPASNDCTKKDPCARVWHFNKILAPGRRHKLVVEDRLTDIYGQKLETTTLRFLTKSLPPGLFLAANKDGDSISDGYRERWQPYDFKAVNVQKVQYWTQPRFGAELIKFLNCIEHKDFARCAAMKNPGPPREMRIKAARDQVVTRRLALPPGLVHLRVQSPQVVLGNGTPVTFDQLLVQTDLGLQAQMTAYGVTVWVTSLRSGRIIAGARIEVRGNDGKLLWEGHSDQRGLAKATSPALSRTLSTSKKPPILFVLASSGKRDRSYLRLTAKGQWQSHHFWSDNKHRLRPQRLSMLQAWEGDEPVITGHISSERGIYRPGHTVYIQGAARRYVSWQPAPAKGRLLVQLQDPNRRTLAEKRVTLSKHGVFTLSLPLPRKAKLGWYQIALSIDKKHNAGAASSPAERRKVIARRGRKEAAGAASSPAERRKVIAAHGFRVAEYRPPRFTLAVSTAPKEDVQAGGPLQVRALGRTLSGGPMDGARYRLAITRVPASVTLADHGEYRAGATEYHNSVFYGWPEEDRWLLRTGAFDAQGQLRASFALPKAAGHWPVSHQVELELRSPSGRTISRTHSVTEHRSDLYVAVHEPPQPKGRIARKIKVVTRQGQARAARVTARLHPVTHDKQYRSRLDRSRVLWQQTYDVGKAGRTISFRWPNAYPEDVGCLLLSVTDNKGHESWTDNHVSKPSEYSAEEGRRKRLEQKRDAQLQVTLDKEQYLPGESATVTIRRDRRLGPVLLSVLRERTFRTITVDRFFGGLAKVTLPVLKEYARTVTVQAVATRTGRALRDPLGPLVRARARLTVSEKPWHLDVGLQADRRSYRPGQKVKVRVNVRDQLSRPRQSQVVLMAVDEGVLQLTGYRLPDPFDYLTRTPPDGVLADDLRRYLARLQIPVVHRDWTQPAPSFVSGRSGSGGGGRGFGYGRGVGSKPRSRFATCAWHATLVTDSNGRASATFTLPDDLTTFRIMAFAVDAKRSAGTGSTSVQVNLPMVALPMLPRFLRIGDEVQAGVTIQNKELPTGPVTVTVRAEGSAIRLTGKHSRTLTVAKGRTVSVRFGLKAARVGEGKLLFGVQVGSGRNRSFEDRFVAKLPVRDLALIEHAGISGETKGAVRQRIASIKGLRPDRGQLSLSLSSSALTGVEEGMDQLLHYPYGCLEQTASRLLPLLAAVALEKRFNFKLGKQTQPRALMKQALARILAMQLFDGGFGYWPSSSRSQPWATAYALVVFHRAQMVAPKMVNKGVIDAALKYLKAQIKRRRWRGNFGWAYRAFLTYALALHGEPQADKEAASLFKDRHRKPLFARAMLLATTARPSSKKAKKRSNKMLTTLTREISDALRVEANWAHAEENLHHGYKVVMHSNDRSTAMVLLALLQARPHHPMVPRLVRWFLLGRKLPRFRNTQEAAWALLALWDYARIREKALPDFEAGVWLGKSRILKTQFRGRSVRSELKEIPMKLLQRLVDRTARDLVFAKRGKGTLYYQARLKFARRTLPDRSRSRGLAVTKSIAVLNNAGEPVKPQRSPRLGDNVLVTLEVTSNEARRYVVIDDPLPAGLEAVNNSLATASRSFGADQLWKGTSYYDHRELRDDRVLFFRDHMQPGTLTYRYLARVTTAGHFTAPPTKSEEMYTPEVYGHTAASSIVYAH